jgi:hypothetical protein
MKYPFSEPGICGDQKTGFSPKKHKGFPELHKYFAF